MDLTGYDAEFLGEFDQRSGWTEQPKREYDVEGCSARQSII
ncbi:MAG: hypothetical protein ACKVS7_15210 [Gemmatimonadaceae bacterium]